MLPVACCTTTLLIQPHPNADLLHLNFFLLKTIFSNQKMKTINKLQLVDSDFGRSNNFNFLIKINYKPLGH